ncbi:hypothetical protein PV11_04378 [Exophiala sideris]|uniref:Transcription factor domain-containing protein n=1 Tax=Exophiala sideris TaxID=1016849 RepID=A0A0D1W0J9_9EURO|nr:hypothetical protein PV11_04378 [Exophiala sideris]
MPCVLEVDGQLQNPIGGVKVAGLQSCQRCTENERQCVLGSSLHFRPVKSVRLKTVDGRRFKHDLKHTPLQVWVDVPSQVHFVSEDVAHEDLGFPQGEILKTEDRRGLDAPPTEPISPFAEAEVEVQQQDTSTVLWVSPHDHYAPPPLQANLQHQSPHSHYSGSVNTLITSPILQNVASAVSSPIQLGRLSWPIQNLNEARLYHHYIVNLSLQFDSCDKFHHFGKEIPKRAAYYPVLKYAIFAVSSRHLCLLRGKKDDESHEYVSKCLRILIAALEDPLGHLDENLLAAVILLRTHEEMSDNDERCHLFGTTRILNSIASFAADGGLRESASWVSLRQHIYICLTSQHPLTINLTNYRDSSVFKDTDDEAWANRIIFLFANILTHVFTLGSDQLSVQQWLELDAELAAWDAAKPWHFSPLYIDQARVFGAPGEASSPWPCLLVCNPAQVVGLQHYHLAKIMLAVYDPRLSKLSFESYRSRRASEDIVRSNLRIVVGLASSNDHVLTAMFQASHILSACGMYLTDQAEQDAVVEFLVKMNRRMGWQTSHIVQNLQEQWRG